MDHLTFAQLLGNYGEFVGAIAVVATLLYLAVQVKHNREQTENQIEQSHYEQWQKPSELLANSFEVSELLVRGRQSRADLTDAEAIQFDMILTMGMNSVEFAFRRSKNPQRDPDADTWVSIASFWLGGPGGLEFWEDQQGMFYPNFVDWVEHFVLTAE